MGVVYLQRIFNCYCIYEDCLWYYWMLQENFEGEDNEYMNAFEIYLP